MTSRSGREALPRGPLLPLARRFGVFMTNSPGTRHAQSDRRDARGRCNAERRDFDPFAGPDYCSGPIATPRFCHFPGPVIGSRGETIRAVFDPPAHSADKPPTTRTAPGDFMLNVPGIQPFPHFAAGRSTDGINLVGARCLPVTRYRNRHRMLMARR